MLTHLGLTSFCLMVGKKEISQALHIPYFNPPSEISRFIPWDNTAVTTHVVPLPILSLPLGPLEESEIGVVLSLQCIPVADNRLP